LNGRLRRQADAFAGAGCTLGKAVAAKCHAESKVTSCRVILPAVIATNTAVIRDFSTSMYQSLYADNRYRTGKKVKVPAADLKSVTLVSGAFLDNARCMSGLNSRRGDRTGHQMRRNLL
jgi:hypothetical protein